MVIKIAGMSCNHCVNAVRGALEGLEGIKNVEIDLNRGEARFENPEGLPMNQIKAAIEGTGYKVVE